MRSRRYSRNVNDGGRQLNAYADKRRMMTFDELIEHGWHVHADDPQRVAADLEHDVGLADNATRASAFLRLWNHTVGEHLHDWRRANGLATRIVGVLPHSVEITSALAALAIAQFMARARKQA